MVETEEKIFLNLGLQIAGKYIFLWTFLKILEFYGKF